MADFSAGAGLAWRVVTVLSSPGAMPPRPAGEAPAPHIRAGDVCATAELTQPGAAHLTTAGDPRVHTHTHTHTHHTPRPPADETDLPAAPTRSPIRPENTTMCRYAQLVKIPLDPHNTYQSELIRSFHCLHVKVSSRIKFYLKYRQCNIFWS